MLKVTVEEVGDFRVAWNPRKTLKKTVPEGISDRLETVGMS
jgi:hypothetical protein